MSVEASVWAWRQNVSPGERLTLLCLADHADAEGVCWPGLNGVAEKSGQSKRTIQRQVKELEQRGFLLREERSREDGSRAADRILLGLSGPGDDLSPPRDTVSPPGVADVTGPVTPVSPLGSPFSEVPPEPPERGSGGPPQTAHLEPSPETERAPGRTISPPRVGRIPVTAAEHEMATVIVEALNQAAGSSYTVAAHLVPLVGRIREHPELTAEDHRAVIAAAFRKPWWTDRPSPAVIYGNAAIFERSLELARGQRAHQPRDLDPVEPHVWQRILDRLSAELDELAFHSFIAPLSPLGRRGSAIVLGGTNSAVSWARERLSAQITRAASEEGLEVEFAARAAA